jgi:hypothetical protein
MQLGELQGEERHPAGSEQQHCLTGADVRHLGDSVPGGEAGARQGRALFESHVGRNRDCARFVQDDIFCKHAVDGAAEGPRDGLGRWSAARPARKESAGDAVADLEPRDAGPDCRDISRAVRERDHVRPGAAPIRASGNQEIAIVERGRANADENFAMSCFRRRPIGVEDDALDADRFPELVRLHVLDPPTGNRLRRSSHVSPACAPQAPQDRLCRRRRRRMSMLSLTATGRPPSNPSGSPRRRA